MTARRMTVLRETFDPATVRVALTATPEPRGRLSWQLSLFRRLDRRFIIVVRGQARFQGTEQQPIQARFYATSSLQSWAFPKDGGWNGGLS